MGEVELELPGRLRRLVRALPALCVLLFAAGVASIAYFPTDNFSSNTYLSENALLPAVADNSMSEKSIAAAASITEQYQRHLLQHAGLSPAVRPSYSRWKAQWIFEQLKTLGLDDVHMHTFRANGKEGVNVIGVAKARRTSGREALVLSSRNDHALFGQKLEPSAVSSMAMGMVIMKHLSQVRWLSKDLMFVVTDDEHGDEGIRTWLKEYHSLAPRRPVQSKGEERTQVAEKEHSVHRGGRIRGALVLDFLASDFSYIAVCAEGVGGKLPNLDLLNAIDRVAAYGEQVYTTLLDVEDFYTRFLYSQERFLELSQQLRTMVVFMLHAASATSTGDHGWFHQYNIDAVTLRLQPVASPEQRQPLVKLARTVEGTVRCLSNLIEHLHQSFYYYILSATFRYVSIGQYLVPFFVVLSASIAVPALNTALVALAPEAKGVDILRSFTRAIICSLFGIFLYYAGHRMPFLLAYGFGSVIAALLVKRAGCMFNTSALAPEGYVTGTTILPSVMFLAPYALLKNFSFCFLAACVFYPLVTLVMPIKGGTRAVRKLQGVLAIVFSLPILLFGVIWVISIYGGDINIDDLISALYEMHMRYSSLLFPFLCLVYAPANISYTIYNLFGI